MLLQAVKHAVEMQLQYTVPVDVHPGRWDLRRTVACPPQHRHPRRSPLGGERFGPTNRTDNGVRHGGSGVGRAQALNNLRLPHFRRK